MIPPNIIDFNTTLCSSPTTESTRYILSSVNPNIDLTYSPSSPINCHLMVTRSKRGIYKPTIPFAGITIDVAGSQVPSTVFEALNHHLWQKPMQEEIFALHRNHTWTLFPATPNMNVVGSKWIFRIKYRPNGSIERYKARIVAQGFHQTHGLDYFETFSPVIKPVTVRIILAIAASLHWPVYQLDINNAF